MYQTHLAVHIKRLVLGLEAPSRPFAVMRWHRPRR